MAKGINIFDSAKGKPKPSSSAKDKPTVEVDGIEGQLNELQNLKTQIANLETQLDVVTDEIKTIAKEKFVELYLENGRNPNTFLLKDGSGCVMVIPTDKYISIKDEDRANQLIETYGEDIVTIDEKYYFNPEVLERNMKAIEKLIRDAKGISDADKQNLLVREVKYSITKGTIDELADYGEDMESVINDIQPIITLKNCGGKMAEGGTDGEFIANIYESGGMMGGKMKKIINENVEYRVNLVPTGDWTNTYNLSIDMYSDEYGGSTHSVMKILSKSEAERMFSKANESNIEDMYRIFAKNPTHKNKKFGDGGGMMSHGGIIAVRNEDLDENSEIDGRRRYAVEIQDKESQDVLDYEYFDSEKEAEDFISIYRKRMASGGLFGNSRYNTGRSWHLDHARHNKKENYEVPVNKRKRRFKK